MNIFCMFLGSACLCSKIKKDDDDFESVYLMKPEESPPPKSGKLRDLIADTPAQTLAFHLQPKKVVLRVSMHCNGCARQVAKRISKMEGVVEYKVDLETKTVMVIGDIVPCQVLQSVLKVRKYAELLDQNPNFEQ